MTGKTPRTGGVATTSALDEAPLRDGDELALASSVGTVLGDRYEILLELASGGMGTVYVGRRLAAAGFSRLVAIKRMHRAFADDTECVAAFHDEARIASLVQHPGVVAIHDLIEVGGEQLLVMDYVDGASLATLLGTLRAARTRPSPRVALRIVVDALRGLHAAHELVDHDGRSLELVHRDATPHNILVGTDGSVRLTDFGIARARARSVHSAPGFAKGKYPYMAPEHAFGDPLDRRADVFSMGVVAWETLTGRRLFANRSAREVARGTALGNIPEPSLAAGTPPELDRIVLKALAPWREDRYDTAAKFADALVAFAMRSAEGAEPLGLASPAEVAQLLDAACGATLRERNARIRRLCAARPARGDEPPPPESGIVRREVGRSSGGDADLGDEDRDSAAPSRPSVDRTFQEPAARRVPTPTARTASPHFVEAGATTRGSARPARLRSAAWIAVALATAALSGLTVAAVLALRPHHDVVTANRFGVVVVSRAADVRLRATTGPLADPGGRPQPAPARPRR